MLRRLFNEIETTHCGGLKDVTESLRRKKKSTWTWFFLFCFFFFPAEELFFLLLRKTFRNPQLQGAPRADTWLLSCPTVPPRWRLFQEKLLPDSWTLWVAPLNWRNQRVWMWTKIRPRFCHMTDNIKAGVWMETPCDYRLDHRSPLLGSVHLTYLWCGRDFGGEHR